MTLDEIKACLYAYGFHIASEAVLPNGTGIQLRLQNETIVNSYHTG